METVARQATVLKGERRSGAGTRLSRALRASGRVPAVVYGHGETPETLSLDLHEVVVGLGHGARTFEVEIGGQKNQFLIKEVQYDHMDETPIHLDLTRVDMNERVTVRVGIELRGTPKGAADGGTLEQHHADIEVECLVSQIPETLHPFVTELGVGDSLLVKDIEFPEGVTPTLDPEERVASVRAQIVEAEESTDEGEAGDSDEPERIGRVRKDDEGGEGDKGKG